MTPAANARLAGFTLLLYIAAGIAGLSIFGSAASGADVPARLRRSRST